MSDVAPEVEARILRYHREFIDAGNRRTLEELREAMDADPSLRPRVVAMLIDHAKSRPMRRAA